MQEENTFKLILKTKTFFISSDLPCINDINTKIILELLENRQYEVKSDISEEVFQYFINYLVNAEPPNILPDNIKEYTQLSQEFGIMKDFIKIATKLLLNYTIPSPLPIQQSGSIIQESTTTDKNERVILNLFNLNGNHSEVQYKLLESSKKENFKFLGIFSDIDVKIENGFLYVLYKNNMTAALYKNISATGDVLIPRSIIHHSQEFIVTCIIQSAFKNSKDIESIQFSEDSELRIIGKKAFQKSGIYQISIPTHVTQICEEAFSGCTDLESIEFPQNSELKILESKVFSNIMIEKISIPSSIEKLDDKWLEDIGYTEIDIIKNDIENIKFYDNFIIGKSNLESDEYDVLLYSNLNSKEFIIPTFIKRIAPFAFTKRLINKIEFSSQSELEIIDKFAFYDSGIIEISIPSSVKRIGDFAFTNCDRAQIPEDSQLESLGNAAFGSECIEEFFIPSKVKEIDEDFFGYLPKGIRLKVSPKNEYFSWFDDSFLIGKSDHEIDGFDTLLYARRDIEKAIIPSFIKRINSNAFNKCFSLKSVTFNEDSQLQSICNSAFFACPFKTISFPSHLKSIGDSIFAFCKIRKIDFPENSELETIGSGAFDESSIRSLSIPSSVINLDEKWCQNIYKLTKISIDPNNKRYSYYNDSIIIGKSNLENDFYDLLLFAPRNIKKVVIPSFIKRICPYAFDECTNLKSVFFEKNSQLKSIENYSFQDCFFKNISIPSSVTYIGEFAFSSGLQLNDVSFSDDSDLRVIEKGAFSTTSLKSFCVPSNVNSIGKFAFNRLMGIIEVNPKLMSFNLDAITDSSSPSNKPKVAIMVPANMKVIFTKKTNTITLYHYKT